MAHGKAHYGAGIYPLGDVSTLRPFAFSFLVRGDGNDIMMFTSICIYLGIDGWRKNWIEMETSQTTIYARER
jgi:hypothetical protein